MASSSPRRREARWGAAAAGALATALLLPVMVPAVTKVASHRGTAGPTNLDARREALAFIDQHGARGASMFVGCTDHRLIATNEMDLYFLSGRIGATRYKQFDPNVVTRRDVQEKMVRELELSRPRVAVLSSCLGPAEPNESSHPGSCFLDDYLASRYVAVKKTGPYVLPLRREAVGSESPWHVVESPVGRRDPSVECGVRASPNADPSSRPDQTPRVLGLVACHRGAG